VNNYSLDTEDYAIYTPPEVQYYCFEDDNDSTCFTYQEVKTLKGMIEQQGGLPMPSLSLIITIVVVCIITNKVIIPRLTTMKILRLFARLIYWPIAELFRWYKDKWEDFIEAADEAIKTQKRRKK